VDEARLGFVTALEATTLSFGVSLTFFVVVDFDSTVFLLAA
jgi:hypothetical protein